jgi:CheY-like chemotaxis protein
MQKIALVVDDSRVARMTLSKLLASHGFDVMEIGSGEEALAYLQSDNKRPDIIFMDVMMGGMDGLTTTQKIKQNGEFNSLPIVICTGNDTEADKSKALSTGAIAVLSKPPEFDALAAILSTLETDEPVVIQQVPKVSAIDETALVANVISIIEQDLLPRLQQDVREMAEDISHQIAADTAEKMVTDQVKLVVDNMLPAIKEQLMEQTTQATEELAQQISRRTAREAVAKSAEQAVQRAIVDSDISSQVLESLSSEGTSWLKHQEQQLQSQLSSQLEQTIASTIEQHLMKVLAPLVSPMVAEQVNKELTQQADFSVLIVEQMGKRLSITNGIVGILCVSVIGLAIKIML